MRHASIPVVGAACIALLLQAVAIVARGANPMLKLEATIELSGVKGRIDHMSVDIQGHRLWVAALGNNTVEIIDLERSRHQRSIAGFGEPQGVLYVPERNRLYVANGSANRVDVLDAVTFEVKKRFDADDADNLRFDAKAKMAVVGYGSGALRLIDTESEGIAGEVKLPAHPESFQLERNGGRIFANVPNAHQIAVVDRVRRAVVATWPTPNAAANFPMALDEAGGRLFVGARRPAVLIVYDTASGNVVARLPIGEDADDVFFDAERKNVYVVCGEGRIDVFRRDDPNHYFLVESVKTAPRARTGLFVPELRRLYVAAPQSGGAAARVLVYALTE